jgi:toxin ParE1/3/4
MADYILTNKAVEDLTEIWVYSTEAWSESQAEKYYILLVQTFRKLAINPGLGNKYKTLEDDVFGFKIGQHIIFYLSRLKEDILILRILHVRMDLNTKMYE